jgi:hypothetical protein
VLVDALFGTLIASRGERELMGRHLGRDQTRTARQLRKGVLVLASFVSLGCGGTIYAIQANSASNKLAEARALGAEQLAPYEFYYAKEHFEKAKSEAAESDYSDAINFAEASEEYAEKAVRLSKEAHRGAGR